MMVGMSKVRMVTNRMSSIMYKSIAELLSLGNCFVNQCFQHITHLQADQIVALGSI